MLNIIKKNQQKPANQFNENLKQNKNKNFESWPKIMNFQQNNRNFNVKKKHVSRYLLTK